MKKFNLVVALFACSLLSSCGGANTNNNLCTVSFETNGGSTIDPVQVVKGNKLKKPKDPTSDKATFSMWCNEKRLVTPYDFSRPVMSDMTLYAKWGNHIFSVSSGTLDNLSVTGVNGEPLNEVLVLEEEDLKLKVTVSGNNEYFIPPFLDIEIDDSVSLDQDEYAIDIADDFKSATLTIYGEEVVGDIVISGKAINLDNSYISSISSCYGLNADAYYKVALKGESVTFTFTALDNYQLPEIENILININNSDEWFNPTTSSSNTDATFIYNRSYDEVTLEIYPNDQDITYINVKLRAPNFSLLEEVPWAQIARVAENNTASQYFYIGESKNILVNNCLHKVRIIDFNHDDLADGTGKAGITFEFENVISDQNGGYINFPKWGNKSDDFPNSILNNQLNSDADCVFSKLPVVLKDLIKDVKKEYVLNKQKQFYDTKLFPLSKTELCGDVSPDKVHVPDEGKIYAFYNLGGPTDTIKSERFKFDTIGNNCPYWTRTPAVNDGIWLTKNSSDPLANFITVDRNFGYSDITVAPAFCI